MEEPNNDIDTETLQAQIDLAMAQAQNLIASWLPESSSGSLTQSSSRTADAEAELQALLRRPPRLGVGAPLPETHAPAQARLVQKLQGSKKCENGTQGAKKKEDGDGDEESSAEESRIGTTRKRTVIDPFEAAGKKKKRRRKDAEEQIEAPCETAEAGRQTVDESATDAFDATTGPTPTPKKKKRKKKRHPPQGQETEEAAHTHNAIATPVSEGDKDVDSEADAMDTDLDAVPGSGERPSLPDLPVQRSPTGAISTGLPVPHLLNLTGPPSMAPEGTEGHPRKKRKRKRKKKKLAGDPP